MCEAKFYICKHCGNIIELLNSSGVPVVCCGDEMDELIPALWTRRLKSTSPS